MDEYKFATITFEHDIYSTNVGDTRARSRELFNRRGYLIVFNDVTDGNPEIVFEDWYVHPVFLDMTYMNSLKINT